jgi:hypothetical protein
VTAEERKTTIAVYALTMALAPTVVFFDFVVKGGDLKPQPERRVKIIDSSTTPHYASLNLSP